MWSIYVCVCVGGGGCLTTRDEFSQHRGRAISFEGRAVLGRVFPWSELFRIRQYGLCISLGLKRRVPCDRPYWKHGFG